MGEATVVAGGKAPYPPRESPRHFRTNGAKVSQWVYYTSAEVSPSTMSRTTSIYNQEERAYGKRRRY